MGRPRKFHDDEVLARATDLFWRDGVDNVSIRDLELALELKAPSIYRRFTSKECLLDECLDRYIALSVGGRIRHLLEAAEQPLDGLREFFTSVLEPHPGETDLRGCLLTNTAGRHMMASSGTRQTIEGGFHTIERAFRCQLERAQQAGHLHDAADPEALAQVLLLSFQGLLVLARSGAADLSRTIDATFDAFIAI
jgi:TetR/AcrR family transcriptional repressor of nem operon